MPYFTKIHPLGFELFHTEGQTDRQTDRQTDIEACSHFRNFANVPENTV